MTLSANKQNQPVTTVVGKDVVETPHEAAKKLSEKTYTRLGWSIVIGGVLSFAVWAGFAPLEKGVPATGTVIVSGHRKSVQHPTGGLIQEVLVQEGDIVKAGQTLIKMNPTQAKANAEATRAQYFAAKSVESRLIAERDGASSITFPPELLALRSDIRLQNQLNLQQQLFTSRQSALRNDLGAMEESLAGLDFQLKGITESRDNKKIQLETLKEQLAGMRDLAKEGYIAKNRVLELDRLYAQVNGAISEDVGNIGRIQKQILETRMRMAQRKEEYQKEVRTQLTDVQRDAESLANRLDATDFELSNTDVKAPTDGMVVGLTVFTNGGVVSPGFNMMDVVPVDEALVVEGQVPVHLIDKVHVGLTVEMMFSAFNQNRTPHVNGEIKVVSGDRLTDPKTGMPYYIVRAQVTPDGMKKLRGLKVRPGMPVDLFIKTGERSMLNYLTKPIMDRAHNAMREE